MCSLVTIQEPRWLVGFPRNAHRNRQSEERVRRRLVKLISMNTFPLTVLDAVVFAEQWPLDTVFNASYGAPNVRWGFNALKHGFELLATVGAFSREGLGDYRAPKQRIDVALTLRALSKFGWEPMDILQ